MNYHEIQKIAHKIGARACETIFNLSEEEKAILVTLSYGPLNLTDIVKRTTSYGRWEFPNRWAVKRRINGSNTIAGLIPYEYVQKRKSDKRIRGKDGDLYCLTTKGMLAVLSEVILEKSYLFKKYDEFIKNILNRRIQYIGVQPNISTDLDEQTQNWLHDVFKNYIKYQLYTFLIWHESNDINLQKKKDFDWHLTKFFTKEIDSINWKIPQVSGAMLDEYRAILRQNKIYSKMFHCLDEIYKIKKTSKNKEKIKPLKENLSMVGRYIYNWYHYFDKLQLAGDIKKPYSIKPIAYVMPKEPQIGIDLEYSGDFGHKRKIEPDLRESIKELLRKGIGMENLLTEEVWKNDNDNPNMLSFGSIPF